MKKYSVLLALFFFSCTILFFSCTREIESSDSILTKYLDPDEISSSGNGGVSSSGNGGVSSSGNGGVSSSSNGGVSSSGNGGVSSSGNGGVSSSSNGGGSSSSGGSAGEASSSSDDGIPRSYQVLSDIHFEKSIGEASVPWRRYIGKGNLAKAPNSDYPNTSIYPNIVKFTPSTSATEAWHLQIKQDIDYKFSYSYHLEVVGKARDAGANTGNIIFVVMRCWNDGIECGDDAEYIEQTFDSDIKTYEYDWNHCDTDKIIYPNAEFAVSGGLAVVPFNIYSISISAEPIECPEIP